MKIFMFNKKIIYLILAVVFVVLAVFSYSQSRQAKKEKNVFPEQELMTLKVYFNNDKLDPEFSCYKVFPVERKVGKKTAVARAAIEELLKGPTEEEKAAGFFTSINTGVKIQKLVVENGTAKVDFDKQMEYQMGGSCRVSAIRSQITETLKQFSTVKNVIISVDGRTEDILQP